MNLDPVPIFISELFVENPGVILLLFIFISYRVYQRSYIANLFRKWNSLYKIFRKSLRQLLFSLKLKPESALYVHERESFLSRTCNNGGGDDVILVHSLNLISNLEQCLDNFESTNFVTKTLAYGHNLVFSQSTFRTYQGYSGTEKQYTALINILQEKKNIDFEIYTFALQSCIKELIIFLEAKSNRENVVDVGRFCYKHSVNILATCMLGFQMNELTDSKCEFSKNCDQLFNLWIKYKQGHNIITGEERGRMYFKDFIFSFSKMLGMENKQDITIDNTVEYFTNIIYELWRNEGTLNTKHCLASIWIKQFKQANISQETAASLLITLSITTLELTSGILAILIRKISSSPEKQERIRKEEGITFNADGIPNLKLENEFGGFPNLKNFMNKCLALYPPETHVTFRCKHNSFIPGTNAWVKASSQLVIPVTKIATTESGKYNTKSVLEKYIQFVLNSQIRTQFLQNINVIEMCLIMSMASLLQEYEFEEVKPESGILSETNTCIYSDLSSEVAVKISRVRNRGRIVNLNKSLRAFHASKNKSFLSKIGL